MCSIPPVPGASAPSATLRWTSSVQGLPDIARHVIGCRLTQENWVNNVEDDVTIRESDACACIRRHQAFALTPVRERRLRVYTEAPGFHPAPRVVRVYDVEDDVASDIHQAVPRSPSTVATAPAASVTLCGSLVFTFLLFFLVLAGGSFRPSTRLRTEPDLPRV